MLTEAKNLQPHPQPISCWTTANWNSLPPWTYDNSKPICFNAHQGLENNSFRAIENQEVLIVLHL